MADITDPPPPKRRRRPAKSCDACRARKVRCDQKTPCGPCTRARSAPKCIYAPDTIRLPSPDATPEDASSLPSVAHTPASVGGGSEADELRRQIQQLQSRVNSLEGKVANSGRTVATPTGVLKVKPIQPRLRQAPDKNKLFGANHWIHAMKHIRAVSVDAKEVEINYLTPKLDFAKARAEMSKLRTTIKQFETPPLASPVPDLLATIPSRSECDVLVQTYMETHEPIYRVLHQPTFYSDYESFWVDQAASSPAFQMTLVLILAMGSVLKDDDAGEAVALVMRQSSRWIYAAQWWLSGPSEKTTFTLDGLRVACLLQLARQMTGLGRAWVTSGSLLQMAFSVGLHRDPGNFPGVAPLQAEMQRRLWAAVRELTLLAAMDSPMHVAINTEGCDTRPPSNIDDENLSLYADAVEQPDDVVTDCSLQRLLARSFDDRMQAVTLLQGIHPIAYTTAISLSNRLQAACDEVAQFFVTANTEKATLYQRCFLDIHFRLHILRLHRQFLLQQPDDASCHFSRKICFDNAMIIASYASSSPPECIHLRRLSRLFVRATGVLRCPLNLEIVTILALELRTQLSSTNNTATSPSADTPAQRLARAARAPIFTVLETIASALHANILNGSPSLKIFGITKFIIAELRPLERGENPEEAMRSMAVWEMSELRRIIEASTERLAVAGERCNEEVGGFDLDLLLAMDFTGGGGGMFDLENFGMGDGLW